MAGSRPGGLRRRDFSFRIRVTEHRLDSLHTTLNVSHRTGNIWTTIPDLARVMFCERRAGKKVTNAPESLVGLHGRVRSCTLRNVVNRYFAPSNSVEVHHSYYRSTASSLYIERTRLTPKTSCPTVHVPASPGPRKTLTLVGLADLTRRWSRRRFITTDREGFTYDRLTEALWLTPERLKMQAWPLLERQIILPQRITSEAPRSPANDTQRRR